MKGLVPSVRERPFISVKRLSRCGKRRVSGLHRCQSSLLPKAIKPYPNKEEGRNKAEKELTRADHCLFYLVRKNAKVTIDAVSEVNVTRTGLSIADRNYRYPFPVSRYLLPVARYP